MRHTLALLAALAAVSCNRSGSDEMTRFHEDGRSKPSVAIASMFDTTNFDANWSLSEEITDGITKLIGANGQIFVHTREESPFAENPFGTDLSWIQREFQGEEFVTFLELVEHEFVPTKSKGQEASHNLNMAARVRVIDLRFGKPSIVLQEMIRDTYFVPNTMVQVDYTIDTWGTEGFRKTPMGMAHAGFIQSIATRVADYILLAKSR